MRSFSSKIISKEIKKLKKTGKNKNQEAKLSKITAKLNSEAFVAFIVNYPIFSMLQFRP
jgi:hypothetical protein